MTALLVAARELKPDGLRPLTYVTLFGLLAATGMRLSEALHLERKDLNLDQPSLPVRESKFKKSRLVPIHISTAEGPCGVPRKPLLPRHVTQGLRRSSSRQKGSRFPETEPSITPSTVSVAVWSWVARGGHAQPRISMTCATRSSARHCCAASKTTRLQSCGRRHLETCSGHAKVSDTYWYISATPGIDERRIPTDSPTSHPEIANENINTLEEGRFAKLVEEFFLDRLIRQPQFRGPQTVAAYRDCFRLLFEGSPRDRKWNKPTESLVTDRSGRTLG